MSVSQKNISHDCNEETKIGLKLPQEELSTLYGYSELSAKILEDFLRPEQYENGLNFPQGHPLFELIKMEHLKFEQQIFNVSRQFVEGYDGGLWRHNPDGIYCLTAEPSKRYHVSNHFNYSDEQCNVLEMGLALTLIALDVGMNSNHNDFARAMIYFRSRLLQIMEEQYEDGCTIINTTKVYRLID